MKWYASVLIPLTAFIYCELVADYIALMMCSWPHVSTNSNNNENHLYAVVLSDTHLLGPRHGHWLDKLYREWHMHRSFQASMLLLRPEIVFVLGDLFDEGDFVNQLQFKEYVQRFHRNFQTPPHVPIISAVGNHDVGFHYKMVPHYTKRFEEYFNNTGVHMYTIKDIHFVFINSMAMQNDGCELCEKAINDLHVVASKLHCLQNRETCLDHSIHGRYSRPILMQHFPTYRTSDSVCKERDSTLMEKYRENWEVLSKESTHLLGELLNPRLAFAGHSHHYCLNRNDLDIDEYTVASFNWRNKINPSFLMAVFTPTEYAVAKCDMLQQQTVCTIYTFAIIMAVLLATFQIYYKRRRDAGLSKVNYKA